MTTTAVIVGIEQYGGPWDLNGPANDAIGIAEWLTSYHIPVTLHLSPLDRGRSTGLDAKPATSTAILHTLTNKPQDSADELFLYWSGHGVMKGTETRRLLYADASERNLLNLDLNSLLVALRTDYFGYSRQIVIVDACANYLELLRPRYSMPDQNFPVGTPVAGREQFVLFSASPGETSTNLGVEAAGLFTRELLHELRANRGAWPPDMTCLGTRMGVRFNELRQDGKYRQTPVFFAYQDWQGNERALGTIAAPPATRRIEARPRLHIDDVRILTDILCELPWMMDASERTSLLLQLRSEIRVMIPRSNRPRNDILSIVSCCERYPQGLAELLRAIEFTDPAEPAVGKMKSFASNIGVVAGRATAPAGKTA
jgi:hypothetical protein